MLTLLLILTLAITVVSIVLYCLDTNREGWIAGTTIGGMCSIALLISVLFGVVEISTSARLTQKIDMYTEENAKIESQITDTIEKYLEHEYNIYESLQGEDIQTLLVVYPEINSNELVKRQIEVFIENNNQIRKLKNEKLNVSVWKFLIYFGN